MKNLFKNFKVSRSMMVWSVLAPLTMVLGFNCGKSGFREIEGFSNVGESEISLPFGLMNSEQLFKSMVQVTGIEAPEVEQQAAGPAGTESIGVRLDNEIVNVYNARKGSLPSQTDVENMNSPMMVAVTNLALSMCHKLVVTEASSSPRFFEGWGFAAGSPAVGADQVRVASAMMARSFWSRDITDEEQGHIQSIILGEYQSGLPSDGGERNLTTAVGLCASMLSSFDAVVY